MKDYNENGTCCICGKEYTHWGNNALPISDGRCCDVCDNTSVIPERIKRIKEGKSIYEKE